MRHYQLLAAQLESLGLVIKELSLDELDQVSVRLIAECFYCWVPKTCLIASPDLCSCGKAHCRPEPLQGLICAMSTALLSNSVTKDWPYGQRQWGW